MSQKGLEDFTPWECWIVLPRHVRARIYKGAKGIKRDRRKHWLSEEIWDAFEDHMAELWDSMAYDAEEEKGMDKYERGE